MIKKGRFGVLFKYFIHTRFKQDHEEGDSVSKHLSNLLQDWCVYGVAMRIETGKEQLRTSRSIKCQRCVHFAVEINHTHSVCWLVCMTGESIKFLIHVLLLKHMKLFSFGLAQFVTGLVCIDRITVRIKTEDFKCQHGQHFAALKWVLRSCVMQCVEGKGYVSEIFYPSFIMFFYIPYNTANPACLIKLHLHRFTASLRTNYF